LHVYVLTLIVTNHQICDRLFAAWLFVCNPQKLQFTQVVKLDQVRRSDVGLDPAYQLAQDFLVMVTKRQADVLDRYFTEARRSDIAEESGRSPFFSSVAEKAGTRCSCSLTSCSNANQIR